MALWLALALPQNSFAACAGDYGVNADGTVGAFIWSASANIDYATDAWAFDVEAGKRVVRARDTRQQVLLVSG